LQRKHRNFINFKDGEILSNPRQSWVFLNDFLHHLLHWTYTQFNYTTGHKKGNGATTGRKSVVTPRKKYENFE
jgi:hypothetical protein